MKSLIFLKRLGASLVLALLAWGTVTFAQAPSTSAPKSQADLEKLLGPIALYPDSLIATMLPASVYPMEIVQAARFISDPNNVAKLDQQPWDNNVKAVARVPDLIKKMNDELDWTTQLGQTFLAQQKEVVATIQALRAKAQKAGTLATTPQQIVVVTNTIIQIQPANPQVVYVPVYNPTVVYAPPPGPPPLLTFATGAAVGAIIANNVDWNDGGVYANGNNNVNINVDNSVNVNRSTQSQKWQPDQSRMPASSASSSSKPESRGYAAASSSSAEPKTAPRQQAPTMPSMNSGFNMGGRSSTPMAGDAPPGGAFSGVKENPSEKALSERGKASRESSKSSSRKSR